ARSHPELAERIAPYRAGYTPEQRRELERRLTSGELRAVITTDALELGIDIGRLDAALVLTFPGTVASLRQMWGRAGRRGRGLAGGRGARRAAPSRAPRTRPDALRRAATCRATRGATRRRTCRCARPAATCSRSWTWPRESCWASPRRRARTPPCTRARCTCT